MQNYKLDYLSIYHDAANDMLTNALVQLEKADTGEGCMIGDAKEEMLAILDKDIQDLQQLRAYVKLLSLKKLQEKYSTNST